MGAATTDVLRVLLGMEGDVFSRGDVAGEVVVDEGEGEGAGLGVGVGLGLGLGLGVGVVSRFSSAATLWSSPISPMVGSSVSTSD